MYFMRISYE